MNLPAKSMPQKGLVALEKELAKDEIKNRIIVALDLRPEDEAAQREAYKFASSVLAEVKRSEGDKYGDLTACTTDSIVMSMIDAATHKIAIDGRKLAYLESRYGKAALQITTNGFVAKIKERYSDFNYSIIAVMKGDVFNITGTDGKKNYIYESKKPFGNENDVEGFAVYISYTKGGAAVSDVHTVTKAEMLAIQAKGKGTAWKDHPLERMKTAAFKRACKWHFRQDATIQNLIDYDNEKNFDLNQPATPVRKSIVENINESIQKPAEEKLADDVIEQELIEQEETVDVAAITEKAEAAISGGHRAYKEWKETLSDKEKDAVRDNHPGWWERAKEVTRKKDEGAQPDSTDEPPM